MTPKPDDHDATGQDQSDRRPNRYGPFNPKPHPKAELPPKPKMFSNDQITRVLKYLDLGSGIAEFDTLLNEARVETSAFDDLLNDRVDLIPGTKGSGKSALYRLFVEFFTQFLRDSRKTVVAHGITTPGDVLFNLFAEKFAEFDESDFQNFWCIYLISLANTQFVQHPRFARSLSEFKPDVGKFTESCRQCGIPLADTKGALAHMFRLGVDWVSKFKPKSVKYSLPNEGGEVAFDLDSVTEETAKELPVYIFGVKENLEALLECVGLNLWLMIDRLDEIFPRRSKTEKVAMRGLLRTLRVFESKRIRVKLFIRDDMLDAVVGDGEGFTALSHITARKSDVLRWSEENLLTMIVKRLFATQELRQFVGVDKKRLEHDRVYQSEAFYRIFPQTVDGGTRRSSTIKWIYSHLSDGKGVVTPRDVIDLLTTARQMQQNLCQDSLNDSSEHIIGAKALKYALGEVSKSKRMKYLEAEFPHMWPRIKKLVGGKTELSEAAVKTLFGSTWQMDIEDMVSLGVLRLELKKGNVKAWKVPFLYRTGLDVKQGKTSDA